MQPQKATSPLRYPGGKQKLHPLVRLVIQKANLVDCTYVEPFAGGAGVALALLFGKTVNRIVINDFDRAIYSFWRAVLTEPDRFIETIRAIPLTVHEWKKQREIYESSSRYSFQFGFSAFFLNRTNHSGILKGGPIGGFGQSNSKYDMSARFNREVLAQKIASIKEHADSIYCYNQDARTFINNYLPKFGPSTFIYFDPPYYNNGRRLYKNFFADEDHKALAKTIRERVSVPWIVSYDNVTEIRDMYEGLEHRTFSLSYSLANKGTGQEVMFFCEPRLCPSATELSVFGINLPNWE